MSKRAIYLFITSLIIILFGLTTAYYLFDLRYTLPLFNQN